jgi:hypothetical protein
VWGGRRGGLGDLTGVLTDGIDEEGRPESQPAAEPKAAGSGPTQRRRSGVGPATGRG